MVIHLQDTPSACAAVMSTIRLPRLTFLAEAQLAIRLDCEGGGSWWGARGQGRVAVGVCRAAGLGEDGCRVGPVEHAVEQDSSNRRLRAYPTDFGSSAANAYIDPYGPRCQAIHESERKVREAGAAVTLDLASPSAGHDDGGRRGRRMSRRVLIHESTLEFGGGRRKAKGYKE